MSQLQQHLVACGVVLVTCLYLTAPSHASSCPFLARKIDGNQQSGWQGQIPGANNASDPLCAMNTYFHAVYDAVGEAIRPVPRILLEGDYLVLEHGSPLQRQVEAINSMKYHNLKMVAHVPLAINVIMLPHVLKASAAGGSIDATTRSRLEEFLTHLEAASAVITAQRFTPQELPRQLHIVATGHAFITQVLDSGMCTLAELQSMSRTLAPLCLENAVGAASVEVSMLHATMTKWRAQLSAQEWEALRVVVTVSHMARAQNLASQFFARYFGVDIFQSHRFITIESVHSEAVALKLMDTHVSDYAVGTNFFKDAFRLHEDLLCAGAKQALDVMFPESANSTIGCFNSKTPIQ